MEYDIVEYLMCKVWNDYNNTVLGVGFLLLKNLNRKSSDTNMVAL